MKGGYWIGYYVTWAVTFIGCWVYAIAAHGFLLGVGLGWLPSAIVATIVAILWPLVALCLGALAIYLFKTL